MVDNSTQQYVYFLRLIPVLLNENNWTAHEHEIVDRHFCKLQSLLADGRLVLARRTLNMDPSGCGLVILEVSSEDEAWALIERVPAVEEGIMTAELFPYRVALMAGKN